VGFELGRRDASPEATGGAAARGGRATGQRRACLSSHGPLDQLEESTGGSVDRMLDDRVHARLSRRACEARDLGFDAHVAGTERLAEHRAERRARAALRARPHVDVGHPGPARFGVGAPVADGAESGHGQDVELEATAVRIGPAERGCRVAAATGVDRTSASSSSSLLDQSQDSRRRSDTAS